MLLLSSKTMIFNNLTIVFTYLSVILCNLSLMQLLKDNSVFFSTLNNENTSCFSVDRAKQLQITSIIHKATEQRLPLEVENVNILGPQH